MDDLLFRITTADKTVIARWQVAFRKEGWKTLIVDCAGRPDNGGRNPELDLVEICTPPCDSPDELQKMISDRKPVVTIAFASPRNISDSQIVKFLGAGADDFVFSNTDERVLVAKLKAYIRRLTPVITIRRDMVTSSCGALKIDRTRRQAEIWPRNGTAPLVLPLTEKELEILYLLVNNEHQVVQREAMLEKLWGDDATEVYSNCINKHIELLRKKLGPLGHRIRTVYGSGYIFS